jgi:hypothetical protein
MTTAEGKKNPEAYLRTQFQKRVTDDQVAIDKGHQPQYSGPVREAMANVNQPSAGEQALNFAGRYAPETGTGFIPWITGPIGPAEAIGRSLGQEGVGAAMGATGGTLVGGAALVAKRLAASILRDKAAMAEALVRAQSPMGRSMGAPQTIPSVPVVPGPATQGVATAGATQAVPPAWQYVTSNYPGNAFGALPSNGSP